MLRTSTRLRIQEILKRLAIGDNVTLQERIYINKYAERDQNVYSWLRKASRLQQNNPALDSVDKLIDDLDLCSSDPNSTYNPEFDDLGEWFTGSQ